MDKKLLKPIEDTNITGKIDCNKIKITTHKIEHTLLNKYVLTIKQNGKKQQSSINILRRKSMGISICLTNCYWIQRHLSVLQINAHYTTLSHTKE